LNQQNKENINKEKGEEKNMKTLSIVIPLYNEEKLIKDLLKKVVGAKIILEKEIIVVNDGSTDRSEERVKEFIKEHKKENIILIKKNNGGKGSALKEGFKKATGDIFIVQDADLEYDPNDYKEVILPIINQETKIVYGSRFRKKIVFAHIHFLVGNIVINTILSVLYGKIITDSYTCYKAFHKDLKKLLTEAEGNKFDYEPEITSKILKKKYTIKEVPINYLPRSKKEGKKISYKDGINAIKVLIEWKVKKY